MKFKENKFILGRAIRPGIRTHCKWATCYGHLPGKRKTGAEDAFKLPIKLKTDEIQSIKLNYQKDERVRCLSTDLTFHWIRSEGEVDGQLKDSRDLTWAFERIAFVREPGPLLQSRQNQKLTIHFNMSPRREASLCLLSFLRSTTARPLPKNSQGTQRCHFSTKEAWFRQQIAKIQVPWEDGHIKINVRRENLLQDSMEATESITQGDMRKIFRFEFISEPGTGGVISPAGVVHRTCDLAHVQV